MLLSIICFLFSRHLSSFILIIGLCVQRCGEGFSWESKDTLLKLEKQKNFLPILQLIEMLSTLFQRSSDMKHNRPKAR